MLKKKAEKEQRKLPQNSTQKTRLDHDVILVSGVQTKGVYGPASSAANVDVNEFSNLTQFPDGLSWLNNCGSCKPEEERLFWKDDVFPWKTYAYGKTLTIT